MDNAPPNENKSSKKDADKEKGTNIDSNAKVKEKEYKCQLDEDKSVELSQTDH